MAMVTKIPIRNLYYLLSYAWGRLPEDKEPAYVQALRGSDTVELLARLLASGVRHAVRQGLNRDYLPRAEEIPGIRGRLQFAESIRRMSFERGRALCEYDELDYNNLPNRIIKTTLETLFYSQSFQAMKHERGLEDEVVLALKLLDRIESVELHPALFHRIRLHRGNAHYGMLLSICELAFDCLLPERDESGRRFKNFVQDQRLMAGLFEDFVRNFYDWHARPLGYTKISAAKVDWIATCENDLSAAALPEMRTDITLESSARKIIVDCKFYEHALDGGRYDGRKLHSGNLYQIIAYVNNRRRVIGWENCEGLLLYPAVEEEFNYAYNMDGNRIAAATVNLDRPWEKIHERLLELIGKPQTAQT